MVFMKRQKIWWLVYAAMVQSFSSHHYHFISICIMYLHPYISMKNLKTHVFTWHTRPPPCSSHMSNLCRFWSMEKEQRKKDRLHYLNAVQNTCTAHHHIVHNEITLAFPPFTYVHYFYWNTQKNRLSYLL